MVRKYRVRDLILGILVSTTSGIVLSLILWMLLTVVYLGSQPLLKEGIRALIESPNVVPMSPKIGGIGPMIYSTLVIVGTCVAIGLPIGFLTGLYLYEHPTSSYLEYVEDFLKYLLKHQQYVTELLYI